MSSNRFFFGMAPHYFRVRRYSNYLLFSKRFVKNKTFNLYDKNKHKIALKYHLPRFVTSPCSGGPLSLALPVCFPSFICSYQPSWPAAHLVRAVSRLQFARPQSGQNITSPHRTLGQDRAAVFGFLRARSVRPHLHKSVGYLFLFQTFPTSKEKQRFFDELRIFVQASSRRVQKKAKRKKIAQVPSFSLSQPYIKWRQQMNQHFFFIELPQNGATMVEILINALGN